MCRRERYKNPERRRGADRLRLVVTQSFVFFFPYNVLEPQTGVSLRGVAQMVHSKKKSTNKRLLQQTELGQNLTAPFVPLFEIFIDKSKKNICCESSTIV
ncbi:uncharacterized protein V6R79_000958 [Siganus canaliculatus]